MEYALVPNNRALIVIEQTPDLIDVSLDYQIKLLKKEVEEMQSLTEGLECQIGSTLHALNFRFPEIARRLLTKINTFRELQGHAPIRADVDPLSGRNKDGVNEDNERAKLEAEAEEAARKAINEMDDKDLSPQMRTAKFIERKRREKCKRIYLKIAKLTHPDKVKDPELNGVFHEAKKMYDALDEDTLEIQLANIREYLKVRGNRGKFRDFKRMRVEHSRQLKNTAENSLKQLKSGMAYKCMETYMSGDMLNARIAYDDFIEEQCYRLQNAIDDLRMQMRVQRTQKSSIFF